MLRRLLLIVAIAAAVGVTYQPAAGFAFLNWDDHRVIVDNAALAQPGVARWAFTTTYMEHYQPVSWLLWAALRGTAAPDPARYHTVNIVLHALATLLVFAVARRLFDVGHRGQSPPPIDPGERSPQRRASSPPKLGLSSSSDVSGRVAGIAAAGAALLYGLHPLRVEVVAWVSAMPYALATSLALAAVLAWLRTAAGLSRLSWIALLLFALSLLCRPLALGVPIVLVILDVWLFTRPLRASLVRAMPFFVVAAAAAGAEFVARVPGLSDAPWPYRLQSALSAPFLYIRHTLAPVSLTPLDVLPLDPVASPLIIGTSLGAVVGLSALAWHFRARQPAVLAAWLAYLALLAPAVGLVPSGLQATADRYTYLPGIVLAIVVAGAVAGRLPRGSVRAAVVTTAAIAVVACAAASRAALAYWSDSVTLWTRVVELDPLNDIGLYNLGVALADAGRPDAAAERYRAVLAVNPGHREARQNLDRLDAARLEHEGNELAARGRLADAAERYREALARDPNRTHAHAARGMALATLGRPGEAIPHLREALRLGDTDTAVANALAGMLVETGSMAEARAVLDRALTAHPGDVGLAHNLARLLVMLPRLPASDRMRAFRLAETVAQATGGQDARALDTLAASLAGIGRIADAREINARAAAVAMAQGNRDLAVQITARGRAYR